MPRAARHARSGPATCSSGSSRASCSSRSTAPRARCGRSRRSSASTAGHGRAAAGRRRRSRRCARRTANRDDARAMRSSGRSTLSGRGLLSQVDLRHRRDAAEGRRGELPGGAGHGPQPEGAACRIAAPRTSWRRRSSPTPSSGAGRRRRLGAAGPARRVHPREHAGRDHRADEPAEAADRRSRRSTPASSRRARRSSSTSRRSATRTFKGKIAYVSPSLDQATRTFAVEALVDNADRRLKPGLLRQGHRADAASTRTCSPCPTTRSRRWPASRPSTSSRTARCAQQQVTLGARQDNLVGDHRAA